MKKEHTNSKVYALSHLAFANKAISRTNPGMHFCRHIDSIRFLLESTNLCMKAVPNPPLIHLHWSYSAGVARS